MIKIWYDYAWGAVMAEHDGVTIKMLDKEDNMERAKLIDQLHETGSQDGCNWITPYSDELWNAVLETGSVCR